MSQLASRRFRLLALAVASGLLSGASVYAPPCGPFLNPGFVYALCVLWPWSRWAGVPVLALVGSGSSVAGYFAAMMLFVCSGAHGWHAIVGASAAGAAGAAITFAPLFPVPGRAGVAGYAILLGGVAGLAGGVLTANMPGGVYESPAAMTPIFVLWQAFTAIPLAWSLRASPVAAGICAECGYDLRASPGACPECGWRPSPGRGV